VTGGVEKKKKNMNNTLFEKKGVRLWKYKRNKEAGSRTNTLY
jgi:hypothetical protein